MLMLLPIALIFAQNSMANLQTVSIIAAFPIGFIIVLIVWSFFKDAGITWTMKSIPENDHKKIQQNEGRPYSPRLVSTSHSCYAPCPLFILQRILCILSSASSSSLPLK